MAIRLELERSSSLAPESEQHNILCTLETSSIYDTFLGLLMKFSFSVIRNFVY